MSETLAERTFLWLYGLPGLQAAVGIVPARSGPARKAGKTPLHRQVLEHRINEIRSRIATGGLRECVIRGLLYVGKARGGADERGLAAIRRLRETDRGRSRLSLAEFKALVREQYFMLLIDEAAALAAIPDLLPPSIDERRAAFAALREVLSARDTIEGEAAERLGHVARLFGVDAAGVLPPRVVGKRPRLVKAS
jgi:hypothetical protein